MQELLGINWTTVGWTLLSLTGLCVVVITLFKKEELSLIGVGLLAWAAICLAVGEMLRTGHDPFSGSNLVALLASLVIGLICFVLGTYFLIRHKQQDNSASNAGG